MRVQYDRAIGCRKSVERQARRRAREIGAALSLVTALLSIATAAPPALAKAPASYLSADSSLVNTYARIEGGKLGITLAGGASSFITVSESPKHVISERREPDGSPIVVDAATDCRDANGVQTGPVTHCTLTIAAGAHNPELKATIAHEVFHVFQAVMSENLENYVRKGSTWLFEGSAVWVESDFFPQTPDARKWWTVYLRSPRVSLFDRADDGVGFFGHLASSGISPWTRFKAMFKATSDLGAYDAASVSKGFLDSEASAFFREPALGSAWDQPGANVPSKSAVGYKPSDVDVAGEETLAAAPHADAAYHLSLKKLPAAEPVLEVRVGATNMRLRATDGGRVNELDPGNLKLCSSVHGCNCPGQAPADLPLFREGNLAITGGPSGGAVRLVPSKRCETLLPAHTCEGVLPGFVVPSERPAEASHAIETVGPVTGYDSYTCLFPGEKGQTVEPSPGEPVFEGIKALLVTVTRYPSIAVAEHSFLPPPDGAADLTVSHPPIGQQAIVETSGETSRSGESEYASVASVRVRNVIATFSITSSASAGGVGGEGANAGGSASLLAQIAEEL